MEGEMKFKIGDRVKYSRISPNAGIKGTVTHVLEHQFDVHWDDGKTYIYDDWADDLITKI
jgi:hypothetical protein